MSPNYSADHFRPVLAEILVTRTNGQIAELIDTYDQVFDGLEHDIKAKTSGPFQNLLLSLLRHSRDETELVDEQLAKEDAMKLIKEGEGQKSINESVFNEVIATRNLVQLRLTFDFYHEVADQDIETGIKQEFGGDDEAGFLALIKCVRNSSEYFADLLQNSINGPVVTHELELIRLVVSRSEIDLADIKHAYLEMHHISLEEAIEANTNGAYGEALLALVKGNQ
ncbi:hypothetical protein niasHT_033375 [Heterodera trifolii]|uniref:Annexin n=1 Tax=Heterodera trifolii TaxID=157864 RepID=A0ABD2I9G3_9BILA